MLKSSQKEEKTCTIPKTSKALSQNNPGATEEKITQYAYSSFLKMAGGKWDPPLYQCIRKIPFIPKETEIDQLIAGCTPRMATFLQILKETGARCGEIRQLNRSWL